MSRRNNSWSYKTITKKGKQRIIEKYEKLGNVRDTMQMFPEYRQLDTQEVLKNYAKEKALQEAKETSELKYWRLKAGLPQIRVARELGMQNYRLAYFEAHGLNYLTPMQIKKFNKLTGANLEIKELIRPKAEVKQESEPFDLCDFGVEPLQGAILMQAIEDYISCERMLRTFGGKVSTREFVDRIWYLEEQERIEDFINESTLVPDVERKRVIALTKEKAKADTKKATVVDAIEDISDYAEKRYFLARAEETLRKNTVQWIHNYWQERATTV